MVTGSMPRDGGNLTLTFEEKESTLIASPSASRYIRSYVGSDELINGIQRYCLWIEDDEAENASKVPPINARLSGVVSMRRESPLKSTQDFADRPHRFVYLAGRSNKWTIALGTVSSETRPYLPVSLLAPDAIPSNLALAIYDGALWNFAVVASRLHLVWIATVCGKLETRYRYSNTLGWNTFPIPKLTAQNKSDLTRCAEDILLAREAHFPATIADLYDPEEMPADLRAAHDRNDEALERIYIGRRFRNDTERLEKLFDMYTKMTEKKEKAS